MFDIFTGINKYVAIGTIICFLTLCAAFAADHYFAQKTITEQTKTLAENAITIDTQNKTIEQSKKDTAAIQKANKNLVEIERANTAQASKLSNKLSKLDAVAKEKPEIAVVIINNAIKQRNRCFEIATGSAILKGETNSVCPQLFPVKKNVISN